MKVCTKCYMEKSLSEFYKHGFYFNPWCKECHKEYSKLRVLDRAKKRNELYKKYGIYHKTIKPWLGIH